MSARRGWAWPLVPLYAAGLAAKNGLRRVRALGTRRLAWPVVSVGSLSAGGAGKTPVVIALAELLRQRGWHVDVLSRGYGRSGSGVERVDGGAKDAAVRFGDEPVVIATSAGLPVWVGTERFLAGEAAEAASPAGTPGLHLLDDGFQHRQLERAVDLVLVTAEDFDDVLLPAGNLRERWSALQRADAVVVREDERGVVEQRVRARMKPGALLWSVRREHQLLDPEWAGKRAVAFCAIARPAGFLSMLAGAGCPVVKAVVFSDHHPVPDGGYPAHS